MFFKKKKPNRLYVSTETKWYDKPRRKPSVGTSRKLLSIGLKNRFSRFFKDFFFYFVALLILIGLISFLLLSSKFSINKNKIEVARNDLYINSAAISNLLSQYEGKSIFTFSKTKAQQAIQQAYPEFSKIEIRKLLPDRIKVELETYDVIANMKAYYTLPQIDEESAFKEEAEDGTFDKEFGTTTISKQELIPIKQTALLNSIGQALFDREENLDLMTITIVGLTKPIEDREFVIPTPDINYIKDSIKYLTNLLQMEVKEVKYLPIAHEIHLTTANNITLWLITKKPYKEQLDRFNTIYKGAELNKEDIAYFDLRASEKVIYCPRKSSCDH